VLAQTSLCRQDFQNACKSHVASSTKTVRENSQLSSAQANHCNVPVVVAFASELCEAYPKESRVNELKQIAIATIALATIFLCLRLYARWLKTRRLWSDDAYAIVAAVSGARSSIVNMMANQARFCSLQFRPSSSKHYWNVPTHNAVELLKLFYVCQMLYIAVQVFSKVAVLALYSRLFPDFIKWFRWSVRGMVAFMVCIFQQSRSPALD
jgi:hypothetical protein